jgi:hypothetical protein
MESARNQPPDPPTAPQQNKIESHDAANNDVSRSRTRIGGDPPLPPLEDTPPSIRARCDAGPSGGTLGTTLEYSDDEDDDAT